MASRQPSIPPALAYGRLYVHLLLISSGILSLLLPSTSPNEVLKTTKAAGELARPSFRELAAPLT